MSTRNKAFAAALASQGRASLAEEDEATRIHPTLDPKPDDPVVVKKRVSAFAGSDLELLLRSLRTEHLVLTGIATSGVVLSTLREAADRDYELTVLHDACADVDDEVHRVLTEKVFPRRRKCSRWRNGRAAARFTKAAIASSPPAEAEADASRQPPRADAKNCSVAFQWRSAAASS